MSVRFPVWCPFLALAVALSGCGPTATPKEEIFSSHTQETAPRIAPTKAPPPTDVVGPAVTPTIQPSAPMPGLVYLDADPEKGMVGPFLVDAGGQSVQLSDKPDPVLSPDRSQLLYSNNGDIWLLDFASGKTLNLTKTKDRVENYYQWWPAHPDLIIFHYQPVDDVGPAAGFLATIKPDGTNYLLLDEEVRSFSPAALSPDGQSIAYDRGGQPWIYNFSGGKMPIFPNSLREGFNIAINPEWSPSGRQIAWQLYGMPTVEEGGSATAILDLDLLTVSLLHRYTVAGGSGAGIYHLAWSPDGKWLAVANQSELEADGKISLWVMRPDGSEEYHLGPGDRPIWSPDGTVLLYSTDDGVCAVNSGEWMPYIVTLPKTARVIDWVKIE